MNDSYYGKGMWSGGRFSIVSYLMDSMVFKLIMFIIILISTITISTWFITKGNYNKIDPIIQRAIDINEFNNVKDILKSSRRGSMVVYKNKLLVINDKYYDGRSINFHLTKVGVDQNGILYNEYFDGQIIGWDTSCNECHYGKEIK
jgi:hypothetical protein